MLLLYGRRAGHNVKADDEWVQADALLKHNEENLSMMRELHEMEKFKERRDRSSKVRPQLSSLSDYSRTLHES